MIVLDTDHLTVLRFRSGERCTRLVARMAAATGETFGTTIINIVEQMKGWLAVINKEREAMRQVTGYRSGDGRHLRNAKEMKYVPRWACCKKLLQIAVTLRCDSRTSVCNRVQQPALHCDRGRRVGWA